VVEEPASPLVDDLAVPEAAVPVEEPEAAAPLEDEPVAPAPPTPPIPKMVVSPVVVVKLEPEAETTAVRAEVVTALDEVAPVPFVAPAAPPVAPLMPKMVVEPLVVVMTEPEAEMTAVSGSVVMALEVALLADPLVTVELKKTVSISLSARKGKFATHVTVAVEEAPAPTTPAAPVVVAFAVPDALARTESADAETVVLPLAVAEREARALAQYWVPKEMTVCASVAFWQAWFAQSRTP